ncbi:MAG: hypothetical protein IT454_01820 [Planctomycetes bacterium]|nr:hypothetical protein [Planctomycetota bacterium]
MLSLFLALALQDPPVGPPVPPAPSERSKEQLLNGVYLIVNEEVVTQLEFSREAARRGWLVTNEEARRRIFAENHKDFVQRMLMNQAGRDAGFPEERVKALVEQDVRGLVEDQGGAIGLGSALKQDDRDIEEFRADRRDYYYSNLWLWSIDGRNPGVTGRQHVDRYVSPSQLHYLYRRQPADRIFPATVQFQELAVSARAAGSAQKALDQIRELQRQALEGSDFGALAAEHHDSVAMRNRKGLTDPIEIADAHELLPDLGEFIESAEPGAISDPQAIRINDEIAGWRVLRLVKRVRRDSPAFQEESVQRHLRELKLGEISTWRRDRALNELYRAAYIWPSEASGREASSSASSAAPAAR